MDFFQEFDIWKLLAGLGIFIFGMFLMEESIRKLSGRAFKKLIREYTTGKIKSISSGIFVTSILQSSSAVSLMVLAFVGAGIMAMENAIGVILGSNIGTTITAWIVAFIGFKINIESLFLPLISFGGLGIIFLGNSERYSNLSKLLVGFGFLFMGLDYMKSSVEVFANNIDISTIPDYGFLTCFLIGIVFTAVMQSSSATLAIVLTTLNAGIINFHDAALVVIGANVGTTFTILLGAIGAVQVKKRVAFSHVIFNSITAVVAIILLPLLSYLVLKIFDAEKNAVFALALFHTIFNVLGVLLFLPFIDKLANFLTRFFPDRKTELTIFINNTTTDVAEAGISAVKNETLHLIRNVLHYNLSVLNIDEKIILDDTAENSKNVKLSYQDRYENLKLLQAEILNFSAKIQSHELSENESKELNRYLHALRITMHSAKSFKDIKHDLEDFESMDNRFLNDIYIQFKKRIVETYIEINKVMDEKNKKDKTVFILRILKELHDEDKLFISTTTDAMMKNEIENLELSTAFIVNRAFIQTSRQILLALKELVLSIEQSEQLDKIQEINELLLENE